MVVVLVIHWLWLLVALYVGAILGYLLGGFMANATAWDKDDEQ